MEREGNGLMLHTARRLLCLAAITAAGAVMVPTSQAWATENPTTGQPGASNGVTCYSGDSTANAPGNSMNAPGSAYNPNGTAGTVYAGNAKTASVAHSNSTAAVSQYDIACLQVSGH
jgi:hypothetical protein